MTTWQQAQADMDSALISTFGESVTYYRPAGPQSSEVAAFSASVILETGHEFASPDGAFYGQAFVPISIITPQPQKNDQMTLATPVPGFPTGVYKVQKVFLDEKAGTAKLMLRWMGAQ
jgi:hypothetical protein